ncbi:hypothetical protein [Actinophytocola sp.]|uniref:hypothetical protein n=1 Tax=Actinophytocola sp. TaxID=1872138 RepID=UPI002D24F5DB|nr:hypothetical protein [Actinophytocola sp.]HYQ62701.1 hypothetical protein [Actinophytocola sp.]
MGQNNRWLWIAGGLLALAVVVGGAFIVTSTLMGDATASGSAAATVSAVPKPISRAALMNEYSTLRPNDSTATPAAVDELAEEVCARLDGGDSTDELITALTDIYQAATPKVVHLFVSYGCPKHLEDFD